MAAIGCQKVPGAESLGGCNDARVDETKRQIRVLAHERRSARDVFGFELLNDKLTVRNRRDKSFFRDWTDPGLKEIGDLGKNRYRHYDVSRRATPPFEHSRMPTIVDVDQCVERTGIGDNGH